MPTAAELQILVTSKADTRGFNETKSQLNGLTKNLEHIRNVAVGVGLYQGVRETLRTLVDGVQGTVRAFNEQAQAERQLNAVLASTGGVSGQTAQSVTALASELQRTTRITDEVVIGVENMLLTFTNIRGDNFASATKAVLDMATAMNNGAVPSLEQLSATSIQVGKALQDPIAGVTALQRVGVKLDDQQKALIKTLVESGRGFEAQQVILAELNKEFGGSATAMTPFERRWDSLNDVFNEAQESIGAFVIGGLNKLAVALEQNSAAISRFAGPFLTVFEAVRVQAEAHLGGIIGVIQGVSAAIGGVADLISSIAHGDWAQAWQSLKDVAEGIMKVMLNSLAAAFGALPNLLIDAVNLAIRAVNSIKLPDKVFGISVPGGGGGLGLPEIPNLNTPSADIEGFFNSTKELDSAVKRGTTAVGDFGEAAAEAAKKTMQLGDALQGAVSAMRSAASGLFGTPTREEASLDLAIAQKQREVASRNSLAAGFKDTSEVAQRARFAQQELDQLQARREVMQADNQVQKLRLTLADQTLLTEREQNTLTEQLIVKTRDFTGQIAEAARITGVSLVPGLDAAFNAHFDLANTLNNDVTPAYRDSAGQVREWTSALAGFMSQLTSGTPGRRASVAPQDLTFAGIAG